MAMFIQKMVTIMILIVVTNAMSFPLVLDQSEDNDEQSMTWMYDEENHVQKRPCSGLSTSCGSQLPTSIIRSILFNGTATVNKMSDAMKKNVFTSRGWGAGGMPFSVLYMNRKSRVHYPPQARQPDSETVPQPLPLTTVEESQANYQKVAQRNASSGRRHYSIIPQLFVSYGWGPIGK